MSESSPYTIEIDGNEIDITVQRIEDPDNVVGSNEYYYRVFANHRSQYFQDQHPDKGEALELIKEQFKQFIEEERNK